VEAREQPRWHVEPGQVGRESRRALGSPHEQRHRLAGFELAQPTGPQRANRDLGQPRATSRLEAVTRPAEAVTRPEHVEQEPSAVVPEHLDDERPVDDRSHRGERLALPNDHASGTDEDLEGG
jgi:hypothetical protein